MRRVFEELHRKLDTSAWIQATLPFRSGGLGLQSCTSVKYIAYVSSILQNLDLINCALKPARLPVGKLVDGLLGKLQYQLDLGDEYRLESLLSSTFSPGSRDSAMSTANLQHNLTDRMNPLLAK